MADDAPPSSGFQVARLFSFLMRYWWVPVASTILCLSATTLYVLNIPPTYVSQARMWETVKLRLPEGDLFTEDVQNFLGTQTELLQSATLHELALQRLKAGGHAAVTPGIGNRNSPPVKIRVTQTSRSSVFVLEAAGSSAAYTQAYLNALMDAYLQYKRNVRKMISGDTLASITEQVQRAERDLKADQDALTAFQQTNNLAILEEEARTAGGYLARLKTQISDLELEDKLLRATSVEPGKTGTGLTNLGIAWIDAATIAGSGSAALDSGTSDRLRAFQNLELLKMQRAKLSQYLRPKHPKLVKLNADIERGERLMDIFSRYDREQLAAMRQANGMKTQNVLASIRDWEGKVVEANHRIAEAERLKLDVQRAQATYDRLVRLVENVAISRNIDQETLAILEPAGTPQRSYGKEVKLLAIATLGGLVLGLGILVLMMLRDDRFITVGDIQVQTAELILGQVPEVKRLKPSAAIPLLGMGSPQHAYAESFRNLRSALLFMETDGARPKVVLITSALPHEGKSTVATNLARALALGGSRVVLVDADLHKGVLHELLGLHREPGLADVLRDPGGFNQVLQSNGTPGLTLLANGRTPGNCGDLFLDAAFDRVLGHLREQFDYVLIDSSPIFAAAEATTLAPKTDGTLLVVRSRFSRGRAVREALELLYQRNARVLGLVFNQVDASARSYYYYKYADYYPPRDAARTNQTVNSPFATNHEQDP